MRRSHTRGRVERAPGNLPRRARGSLSRAGGLAQKPRNELRSLSPHATAVSALRLRARRGGGSGRRAEAWMNDANRLVCG
eukprot:345650-Chlamydomonas_euryale.AAC.3